MDLLNIVLLVFNIMTTIVLFYGIAQTNRARRNWMVSTRLNKEAEELHRKAATDLQQEFDAVRLVFPRDE